MSTVKFDLCVIGGGPAGMMCAYTAAKRGLRVLLLDPNRQLGRKLRITGKGRCNVTNNCEVKEMLRNVPSNPKFLYSSLTSFPPEQTISFFEDAGVPLKTERGNRVFPVSDNANDIADVMASLCSRSGVIVRRDKVTDIQFSQGIIQGVLCSDRFYRCGSVAVCTGGASYPLTGSTGDGYIFAKKAGHDVHKPRPSLVPLESDDEYCQEMQGLSLKNIRISVFEDNEMIFSDFGEMLFTHFGVSGPVILSASSHMRKFGSGEYRIEIDLKPALDEKTLDQRLLRDFQKYSNREFKNSLTDLFASAMIPVIVSLSGISPDKKVNAVTKEERNRLLHLMKSFPVSISGTRPIDEAIVTSGGVDPRQLNPRTMESKLISGLYFAGEIIDVDAYTGGFNLQIAWATGYTAGSSIPKTKESIPESEMEIS